MRCRQAPFISGATSFSTHVVRQARRHGCKFDSSSNSCKMQQKFTSMVPSSMMNSNHPAPVSFVWRNVTPSVQCARGRKPQRTRTMPVQQDNGHIGSTASFLDRAQWLHGVLMESQRGPEAGPESATMGNPQRALNVKLAMRKYMRALTC